MDQWEWYCNNCEVELYGSRDIYYDAKDNVHCNFCNGVVQKCGKPKIARKENEVGTD